MSVTAIHLRIHGLVQNVGYRGWLLRSAQDAGVNGWVRNLPDGTVEAMLTGDAANVARIHQLCERGPNAAHVTRIDVNVWSGDLPQEFTQHETPAETPETPGEGLQVAS